MSGESLIVAVTGSRERRNRLSREQADWLRMHLAEIVDEKGEIVFRHGDAEGVDFSAALVAKTVQGVDVKPFPADWVTYDRAAGPIRNGEMIRDACILFAFPGGDGTADCVRQAQAACVRIVRWTQ